ncbi:MAG: hypothetical protein E7619_04005 [Ruminococcaceae bacterium]|nr:hypothetical protein [Oscillospiraceae bacterium]
MDLKKFKLLSVLLLAAAVLFLSVNLIRNKNEAENFGYSVAENMSKLYEKNGISLDPSLIPLSRQKLSVYVCTTADGENAENIATKIGNSNRTAANLTDTGYIFRLENGALARVSREFYTVYDLLGRSGGAELTAAYKPTPEAEAIASELIKVFLGEQWKKDSGLCGYELISSAKIGSNTLLNFELNVGGVKLYGKELAVYLDSGKRILSAEGTCLFSRLERQSGVPRYDVLGIMKAELDRLESEGITSLSVSGVELCYITEPSADGGTLYFLPGWVISYSDGTVAVYDCVNCAKH